MSMRFYTKYASCIRYIALITLGLSYTGLSKRKTKVFSFALKDDDYHLKSSGCTLMCKLYGEKQNYCALNSIKT